MTRALTTLALLLTTATAAAAPPEADNLTGDNASAWTETAPRPVVMAPPYHPLAAASASNTEPTTDALAVPVPPPTEREHKPGSRRVGAILIGLTAIAAVGSTAYIVSQPDAFSASGWYGGYGRVDNRR